MYQEPTLSSLLLLFLKSTTMYFYSISFAFVQCYSSIILYIFSLTTLTKNRYKSRGNLVIINQLFLQLMAVLRRCQRAKYHKSFAKLFFVEDTQSRLNRCRHHPGICTIYQDRYVERRVWLWFAERKLFPTLPYSVQSRNCRQ